VPDDTAVLLIDAQLAFLANMHGDEEAVLARLERLLMFAEMLDLPVVATLERPLEEKGGLPERLERLAGRAQRFEKSSFNAIAHPAVRAALDRRHVAVAGAETDVCVLQTVLALRDRGYWVTVLEDCCFTSEHDPRLALARMADAGAVRTTFKAFAYELLGTVDRDEWPARWREKEHLFPPPEELPPLRREYENEELRAAEFHADPIVQFGRWFAEAQAAGLYLPDALSLATAGADGAPDARMVVLRGCDHRGFAFYTDYRSTKAKELDENPRAALVFFWNRLDRQVRIRGRVERVAPDESGKYFAGRPRASRIAAWASPQSEEIADRAALDARVRETEARFEGKDVPAPESWGGYRVVPDEVEFWQGRPNRLHDRFLYRRGADGWERVRLAP